MFYVIKFFNILTLLYFKLDYNKEIIFYLLQVYYQVYYQSYYKNFINFILNF